MDRESIDLGEAYLAHYGVKGMKWGVRKDRSGASRKAKREDRKDARWEAKRNRAHPAIGQLNSNKVHQIAKDAGKRMRPEIRALNKSSKYNTREAKKLIKQDRGYYKGRNPVSIAYKKDASDIYMRNVRAVAAKHLQVSPSGKWQESLEIGPDYWNVTLKRANTAKHSSSILDPDISINVRPIMDEEGYIIDFELLGDNLEQTSIDRGRDYLAHYGVKGMKWGVRRNRRELARARGELTGKAKSAVKERREGADARVKQERKAAAKKRRTLDDSDVDNLIKRIEKEKKLKTLVKEDVSPGKKFIEEVMSDAGKRTATTFVAGGLTALVAMKLGDTVARGKLKK